MPRLGALIVCCVVGLCVIPVSVLGSGSDFDSTGMTGLIESSDLIVFAEVTDVNLSSLFGHVQLTVISVWHEHFAVSGAWDPKRLPVMTQEELSEGQEVVAFIEYNPDTTRWFASVGVLSDNGAIASGHPTLVGKRRDDLWASVTAHEHSESVAKIIAWAELIGLARVESCAVSGLSGLDRIRVLELWHGHAGMDEYWDGKTLVLSTGEEHAVSDTVLFFVRYNRNASLFDSLLGVLSDSLVTGVSSAALYGEQLDVLRAAVAAHER